MNFRKHLTRTNFNKAVKTGKEILNALPSINTDQLNSDYGDTLSGNPEGMFSFGESPHRERKQNRHSRKLRPRKVVYY